MADKLVDLIWSDHLRVWHGLPKYKRSKVVESGDHVIDELINLYFNAHRGQRWPLYWWSHIIRRAQEAGRTRTLLALPWWNAKVTHDIIHWVTAVINRSIDPEKQTMTEMAKKLRVDLESIHRSNTHCSCQGTNMSHILTEAARLGIPAREYFKSADRWIFRLGEGGNAKLYESTFSCGTSGLGIVIARNKADSAKILSMHGVPVPEYALASNTAQALSIAKSIGFPVAIKPINRDGGAGVYAGLTDLEQVRDLAPYALEHSSQIIVQKHVGGLDYRFTIANGEIIKLIKRLPGGVVGDGVSSIAELVESNTARMINRGKISRHERKAIYIDEEATMVLKNIGFSPNTIPPRDQFVPLRAKANISAGGSQVIVEPSELHPDNSLLALRCAAIMRLDIAGVDLILKDHRLSWINTGGMVLEVNAQPEIGQYGGRNVYSRLIQNTMQDCGHINYHILTGHRKHLDHEELLRLTRLAEQLGCDGISDKQQVIVRNCVIAKNLESAHHAARVLLNDPSIRGGVSYLSYSELYEHGLPTNQIRSWMTVDGSKTKLLPRAAWIRAEVINSIQRYSIARGKRWL